MQGDVSLEDGDSGVEDGLEGDRVVVGLVVHDPVFRQGVPQTSRGTLFRGFANLLQCGVFLTVDFYRIFESMHFLEKITIK